MKIKNVKVKPLNIYPHNLSITPGEIMRIHVFEKEIKAIINNCFANGNDFIIPLPNKAVNFELGLCVKLLDVERFYPDGKMDVKIIGHHLVKINHRSINSELYQQGLIEKLIINVPTTHLNEITTLYKKISGKKTTTKNVNSQYVFDIANQLELSTTLKRRLLLNATNPVIQSKILLNELRIISLTTDFQEKASFRSYMN